MKTFYYFNNTGGINQEVSDLTLNNNDAEDIVNLHATAAGRWSGSNVGFTHINDTPLGNGTAIETLYAFTTLAGVTHVIASAGGTLYTVEPGSGQATEQYSGLSGTAMNFSTFNGLLIGSNGVDPPIQWNGLDAVSDLPGWPPVIPGIASGVPNFSAVFANRLIFSGDNSNPSVIYLSALEDPETFTPGSGSASAGAIQVSPGDGEKITALKTLFLPIENEEVLVIFKESATYLLTGNDAETFVLQKLSSEFGAVSHRSVTLVGNQLMVLSKEGIMALSTATQEGNLTTGFLSNRIQKQMSTLNAFQLKNSFCLHLRSRQEVWWFVTASNSTTNQTVLVYNYGLVFNPGGAWSRRAGLEAACGLVLNNTVYTGNYAGQIARQNSGNHYDGQPIAWVYRTGFYDFNAPRSRKRVREIVLQLKQISTLSLTVNLYWDFKRGSFHRQTRTLSVLPDASSATFGVARFGEDTYNVVGISTLRFTPSGSGRYFQLELTGEAIDAPVEIEGWQITVHYGGSL
ncbi:MAG: hypothetical protein AAGI66_07580 [Cyanobacteria bacterium P01_H01_bin.74]